MPREPCATTGVPPGDVARPVLQPDTGHGQRKHGVTRVVVAGQGAGADTAVHEVGLGDVATRSGLAPLRASIDAQQLGVAEVEAHAMARHFRRALVDTDRQLVGGSRVTRSRVGHSRDLVSADAGIRPGAVVGCHVVGADRQRSVTELHAIDRTAVVDSSVQFDRGRMHEARAVGRERDGRRTDRVHVHRNRLITSPTRTRAAPPVDGASAGRAHGTNRVRRNRETCPVSVAAEGGAARDIRTNVQVDRRALPRIDRGLTCRNSEVGQTSIARIDHDGDILGISQTTIVVRRHCVEHVGANRSTLPDELVDAVGVLLFDLRDPLIGVVRIAAVEVHLDDTAVVVEGPNRDRDVGSDREGRTVERRRDLAGRCDVALGIGLTTEGLLIPVQATREGGQNEGENRDLERELLHRSSPGDHTCDPPVNGRPFGPCGP